MKTLIYWIMTVVVMGIAQGAHAVTAVTVNGRGSLVSDFSMGWAFTVNQAITVTDLGTFDSGGDGLLSSHEVALYGGTSTLLTSGTVAAGTASPLVGNFRYTDVADVNLVVGQTYVVVARTGTSDIWLNGTAASAAEVTLVDGRYARGSACTGASACAPDTIVPGTRSLYFGANFKFTPTGEVPLPAAAWLFLSAIGGLVYVKRTRN